MEITGFYNVPCEAKKVDVCETFDALPEPMRVHAHQVGHDNVYGMFSVVDRMYPYENPQLELLRSHDWRETWRNHRSGLGQGGSDHRRSCEGQENLGAVSIATGGSRFGKGSRTLYAVR